MSGLTWLNRGECVFLDQAESPAIKMIRVIVDRELIYFLLLTSSSAVND